MSKELQYHVRKTWEDAESQVGIDYSFLANAKKACDKLEGYMVFDSNGNQVYPENADNDMVYFKIGDMIMIKPGAILTKGKAVSEKYIGVPMYIINIRDNCYAVAESMDDVQIGYIHPEDAMPYTGSNLVVIDPYYVTVMVDTDIKLGPAFSARTLEIAKKFAFYKIVNEKDGWGKLEIGQGWINLEYTEKV